MISQISTQIECSKYLPRYLYILKHALWYLGVHSSNQSYILISHMKFKPQQLTGNCHRSNYFTSTREIQHCSRNSKFTYDSSDLHPIHRDNLFRHHIPMPWICTFDSEQSLQYTGRDLQNIIHQKTPRTLEYEDTKKKYWSLISWPFNSATHTILFSDHSNTTNGKHNQLRSHEFLERPEKNWNTKLHKTARLQF